jgi:hypothetical protein
LQKHTIASLPDKAKISGKKQTYSCLFESNYPRDTQIRKQTKRFDEKEIPSMSNRSSNKLNVPEARAAMDKFKMEAASDQDASASN